MTASADNNIRQRIYTVSELTAQVKAILEENFPFIWVAGEISNFRTPVSGHFYFTLKDEDTQISGVMFGGRNRLLRFVPEDGMLVTGLGRISVYPPRGTYQIIFEYLEPAGAGALQAAFDQLRTRLAAEGLFDEAHKKPLPFLPRKISIITSPTGAVVHDILKIITRRFPNLHMEIIPAKVQGAGAEEEIAAAIELLNHRGDADAAILARGGGSLEDLQAFNSERVARAIFASEIPIISAVGHETDFTIADFVSDLRAPTPSAAAELIVPLKQDLEAKCARLSEELKSRFRRYIADRRTVLNHLSKRLTDPKKRIQELKLKTDDLSARLVSVFISSIRRKREDISWRLERLHALSPLAILSRGYSIIRTVPDGLVVRDSEKVNNGQTVEATLAKGSLICRIEGKR